VRRTVRCRRTAHRSVRRHHQTRRPRPCRWSRHRPPPQLQQQVRALRRITHDDGAPRCRRRSTSPRSTPVSTTRHWYTTQHTIPTGLDSNPIVSIYCRFVLQNSYNICCSTKSATHNKSTTNRSNCNRLCTSRFCRWRHVLL